MINRYIFIIILGLSGFLRIYGLNSFPPALNWDEVSLGFNAYSILKTGQDEWGNRLPLSFRAYGDYKLPGYVYLDVPFIVIFGLNEWGIRMPSAIFGIATTALIFLILKHLVDTRTALWGMFIAAILPWSVILSRIALEANLTLFLTVAAVYSFLIGLGKKNYLILSSFLFGFTVFSYNSSRIVTPLLIIFLAVFYRKELITNLRYSVLSLVVFFIFFIIAFPRALLQDSSARYKWTTILDTGAIARIEELRNDSTLNPLLVRIVYNRMTFFMTEAGRNYIIHFDPRFLMINGGSHYQFSVPGHGLIYLILLPFLIIGLLKIFKEKIDWQLMILFWLLIAPLPAAITRDSPHSLRGLLMIPPLVVTISLGISHFLKFFKNKVILNYILVVILLISLGFFWQKYTGEYTKNYSWVWQYGYKQAVNFIKSNSKTYDKIYLTKRYGEPHEFLLFYLKYNPEKYMNNPNLIRYQRSDWFWVDRFDQFYFINDWDVRQKAICDLDEKCLLITSPDNYPPASKVLEKIKFLDSQQAFDIVELVNVQ